MLPGDLEDAITRFGESWNTFAEHRGLILVEVALKYKLVRDVFTEEWRALASSPGSQRSKARCHHGEPTDVHVQRLYSALVRTAQKLDMQPMPGWADNCGRQVSHHSGWLAFLQRVGVLCKLRQNKLPPQPGGSLKVTRSTSKKMPRGRQKTLRLGSVGACYRVAPLTPRVHSKLAAFFRMSEVVDATVPPKACVQLGLGVAALLQAAVRRHILKKLTEGSYFGPWLARSFLIAAARRHGVRQMQLGNISAAQFSSVCPDQKGWVERLCLRAGPAKALQDLGYRGPPELFSMYAYIFNDPLLASVSSKVLQEHSALLKRSLAVYKQQYGLFPHPVVLLKVAGLAVA